MIRLIEYKYMINLTKSIVGLVYLFISILVQYSTIFSLVMGLTLWHLIYLFIWLVLLFIFILKTLLLFIFILFYVACLQIFYLLLLLFNNFYLLSWLNFCTFEYFLRSSLKIKAFYCLKISLFFDTLVLFILFGFIYFRNLLISWV